MIAASFSVLIFLLIFLLFWQAPMFVNCPDIGAVGTDENVADVAGFTSEIDATQESTMVFGSHQILIFQADEEVTFLADGAVVASTQTNVMGAYQLELRSCVIPMGTTELEVMAKDATIRTIAVNGDASSFCAEKPSASPTASPTGGDSSSVGNRLAGFVAVLASFMGLALLF